MQASSVDLAASVELELAIREAVRGCTDPLDDFLRSGRFLRLQAFQGALLADYVSGKIKRKTGRRPDEAVQLAALIINNRKAAARRRLGVKKLPRDLSDKIIEGVLAGMEVKPDQNRLMDHLRGRGKSQKSKKCCDHNRLKKKAKTKKRALLA